MLSYRQPKAYHVAARDTRLFFFRANKYPSSADAIKLSSNHWEIVILCPTANPHTHGYNASDFWLRHRRTWPCLSLYMCVVCVYISCLTAVESNWNPDRERKKDNLWTDVKGIFIFVISVSGCGARWILNAPVPLFGYKLDFKASIGCLFSSRS